MMRFRNWRKMSWAMMILGAVSAVLVLRSGFALPLIGLAVAGMGVLWTLWYLSQPLHRQGRGLSWRRVQYAEIPFSTLSKSDRIGD